MADDLKSFEEVFVTQIHIDKLIEPYQHILHSGQLFLRSSIPYWRCGMLRGYASLIRKRGRRRIAWLRRRHL
jgi:hypothetical protein